PRSNCAGHAGCGVAIEPRGVREITTRVSRAVRAAACLVRSAFEDPVMDEFNVVDVEAIGGCAAVGRVAGWEAGDDSAIGSRRNDDDARHANAAIGWGSRRWLLAQNFEVE